MTVTVSLTVMRLPAVNGVLVVTGPASACTAAEGTSDFRGSGMMTIPGWDTLGRSDAEVCAEGAADASDAGAGFFEGLLDVSSVVGTETTKAVVVDLSAVVEGIIEPEPASLGDGLATARELDELDLILVVVGPDENVDVSLGIITAGELAASVERLVSDDFPV